MAIGGGYGSPSIWGYDKELKSTMGAAGSGSASASGSVSAMSMFGTQLPPSDGTSDSGWAPPVPQTGIADTSGITGTVST